MPRRFLIIGLLFLAGCTATDEVPYAETGTEQTASSVVAQSSSSTTVIAVRPIRLVAPDGSEVTVQVEDALTREEQALGLMHRTILAPERGMLFTFGDEKTLNFWMKNTLIPLDILYFDAGGNFVSASTMRPCATENCPTYPSDGPAKYALEVNAGLGAQWGVMEGWKLVQE